MRPALEDEWDLEPRDDDPDGVDAYYIRESSEPEIDNEDRAVQARFLAGITEWRRPRGRRGLALTMSR